MTDFAAIAAGATIAADDKLPTTTGRKGACEAQTVVSLLHGAARTTGSKLAVRRFDGDAETCAISFKIAR